MQAGPIRVSENGRYFVDAQGQPFFWLGDTAWPLFARYTREDAEKYLKNRAEKGFTVIQGVLAWGGGTGFEDSCPAPTMPEIGPGWRGRNSPTRPTLSTWITCSDYAAATRADPGDVAHLGLLCQ